MRRINIMIIAEVKHWWSIREKTFVITSYFIKGKVEILLIQWITSFTHAWLIFCRHCFAFKFSSLTFKERGGGAHNDGSHYALLTI